MSRIISRAEAWEVIHDSFNQINFNAFDFETIKTSLIEYLKIYFPENFNDFIESSELIAIIELFAYVGELLSYRIDLNAHENFISTAQRKESILRLAKLISYKAHRNIPARGLVKVHTVQTTENVIDSNGINLANTTIRWNDNNNPRWKEQFILVFNKVLKQKFGTVNPSDRKQVDDVLFEVYTLNNNPLTADGRTVFSYQINVSENVLPMEIVPIELTDSGPIEKRPEVDGKFTILYASDGLGDSSDTTGFLLYTKQGTLQHQYETFDGQTPNISLILDQQNINETDVWINNVDADKHQIIETDPNSTLLPHLVADNQRFGEWFEVDLISGQNIIFNLNTQRHKYELETLDNDKVKIHFGDGEYADIPSGLFDIWYRISANTDIVIPQSSVNNVTQSFSYTDSTGNIQTFTFTVSLISSLTNAAKSEDIEHIRKVAPSVYYTQDRMVNGADYNLFPLKDSSILKLRTLNRTFVGDSQYSYWYDGSTAYENVKLYANDLALYWDVTTDPTLGGKKETEGLVEPEELIVNYLEPLLVDTGVFTLLAPLIQQYNTGLSISNMRKFFYRTTTTSNPNIEFDEILAQLQISFNNLSDQVKLYYKATEDMWTVTDPGTTDSILVFVITPSSSKWTINWNVKKLIAHSEQLRFWDSNNEDTVVDYQTLDVVQDRIVVLQANTDNTLNQILDNDIEFAIIKQLNSELPTEQGLPDLHRLSVLPIDVNGDGVADDIALNDLIGANYVYFHRESTNSKWIPVLPTADVIAAETNDVNNVNYKKEVGRFPLNFTWWHYSKYFHLIDPSPTNINDMFIITNGYYKQMQQWINGDLMFEPKAPTPTELKNTYAEIVSSKMISDEVVMHPGKFKLLFGAKSDVDLQGSFKVIASPTSVLNENEIKIKVVTAIKNFFDIQYWEFGERLYITELYAYVHYELGSNIDSIVLVPFTASSQFGDLFEVQCRENEIFMADVDTSLIELVSSLTPEIIRQEPG